ncbi:hypothetical protein PFICI_02765 [Pestalotiopsis fici W106-1]|uniref:Uncharacterized protein n=1 Tax=Pestalotiopsis fici (strain W106-1 / CGMCC3.15140) TaxID=1229662 RepID=W3XFE3_PESFW|nr:uncharacterized protein PFICI_02765 [Pestalotiopsis fici W106-1]ETS84740.1 hypothetical protein PFICI_02765 [Pestalotiopsis fici W106-1]
MPVDENKNLYHEAPKPTDPAHASSANTNHTTKSGTKPTSAVEAITDPDFFPTLEKAPLAQKVKSTLFLAVLVYGAVAALWLFGFTLFQQEQPPNPQEAAGGAGPMIVEIPLALPDDAVNETALTDSLAAAAREVGLMTAGFGTVILAMLYSTGTTNVDFWSLVMEYGWWTLPVMGAAGLLFVIMQEDSEDIKYVS